MSYNVQTLASFDKQLKRLVRKYPSLKAEYITLIELLEENPASGTYIGNDCYKLRLSIFSKGKGKSGGARVIYYVRVDDTLVMLLSIYDKSEQENISDKDLEKLLKKIL